MEKNKPVSVVIKKSTKPEKKLMAVFTLKNGRKTKTKDKQQKQRYLSRHRQNENWNSPMTAGALSRWILWNKETRGASITDYKKRFNLK